VLVISMSTLARDPRVTRQIAALKQRFDVITSGFGPSVFEDLEHVDLPLRPPQRRRSALFPPTYPTRAPGVGRNAHRVTLVRYFVGRELRRLTRKVRQSGGKLRRRVPPLYPLAEKAARRALAARAEEVAGSPRRSFIAEANIFASPRWRRWRELLDGVSCDAIVVNDMLMLPLAFRLRSRASVIFDAHEHAPSQNAEDPVWRRERQPLIRYIEARYLPHVAGMMVVSPGIGDLYHERTGVRSEVVTNAPSRADLSPSPVDPEAIRLVHIGVAHPQRRLDLTIEAVASLDERYSLDLYLIGREDRLEEVKGWAAPHPRIRVLPPVPMGDLVPTANRYDVGVHMLPLDILNHRLALPNKFFEYVQARLAVAIGPSPEMAGIAREWGFGLVADDYTPAALARAIDVGAEAIAERKARAHQAATVLNAEANANTIIGLVEHALAHSPRG
jgi:glycosyltransferase involved in cell wall biosynthesis